MKAAWIAVAAGAVLTSAIALPASRDGADLAAERKAIERSDRGERLDLLAPNR